MALRIIEAVDDYLRAAAGGTETAAETKSAFEELKRIRADMKFVDGALLEAARERYAHGSNDDLEIDDGAMTSEGNDGTWVQAWVWMHDEDN